jgi:putative selenium metabolism hydrolase
MARDLSFDRVLSFAQALIRIPSPPGNEAEVAEQTRREMETLGFDDVWVDGAGSAIGRIRGRGEAPPVMLSCHLDIVDIGDASTWEYDPYGGIVDGGYLHGRGAMDIKGPLAIQTYAAAHFVAHRPAGDVYVAHTVLEERGGWGMEHLLEQGDVRPAAVIIGEATSGDICIGHRGRAELIIEITGVAGHASAPGRAHNPLYLLARVLPAIQAFADQLNADPILGRATLAPTAITTKPTSHNVIPDLVSIVVDWRVLPDTTAETAARRLEAFLHEHAAPPEPHHLRVRFSAEQQHTWTGLQRERRMFTPGFLMPQAHPVVQAAGDTIAHTTGRVPVIRPWTFATDGGHSCGVHHIPTIGFAPGDERYAHTNRERLELASARVAYDAYPSLIAAVQAVSPVLPTG